MLITALTAFATLAPFATPKAHAQANVLFSGGNGTPLSFQLQSPLTYNITEANGGGFLEFIFRTPSGPPISFTPVAGSITFSVNGIGPLTINTLTNGVAGNDVIASDTFLFGATVPLTAGYTVVLSSGTLTTTSNFADAPPASGTFTTFIADGTGRQVSTNGVSPLATAAPEPGSLALLLPVVGVAGMVLRKRRKLRK